MLRERLNFYLAEVLAASKRCSVGCGELQVCRERRTVPGLSLQNLAGKSVSVKVSSPRMRVWSAPWAAG